MTHKELREAITAAMKARDSARLLVLRGILSSITNDLLTKGKKPSDEATEEEVDALIRRAGKQRKDSIEQFEKGGRADLAENEKEELAIIETLLPPLMHRDEIEKIVHAKATELGITEKSQANKLIGTLMKELKGKADGVAVKEVVDSLLV